MGASEHPDLKFLHTPATLNRGKLDLFRSVATEDLIASLQPGRLGALKARSEGTVLDGHHRLHVLQVRGAESHRLPRETMESEA